MAVDYYNNFRRCVTISLCCSNDIYITQGDIQHFTELSIFSFSNQISLIYNNETLKLGEVEKHMKKKDWIFIDNIVTHLYELYSIKKQKLDCDIFVQKSFLAIAKYFNRLLVECMVKKALLKETYLILVLPNDWEKEREIIELVLVPLFTEVGFTLLPNYSERASFISKLEASLSPLQLNSTDTPGFFQNENRCIIYDVFMDCKTTKLKPTYFQLKEDYSLRAFNKNYYVPKILQEYNMNESLNISNINIDSIKSILEQHIFEEVLNCDDLANITLQKNGNSRLNDGVVTIADQIMKNVLLSIIEYCPSKRLYLSNNVNYGGVIGSYLTESQITLMKSASFLDRVTDELTKLLKQQLVEAAKYIAKESIKIPFVRKSIIINNSQDDGNGWFFSCMSRIFTYLLQKVIGDTQEEDVDHPKWHFILRNTDNVDINNGAFLKIARFSLVSNVKVPPLITTKETRGTFNSLHNLLKQPNTPPKLIVYIDISLHSTHITCESVNKSGIVLQQTEVKETKNNLQDTFIFGSFPPLANTRTKRSHNIRKLKERFQRHKKRLIDTSAQMSQTRSLFLKYLENQLEDVDCLLKDKKLKFEQIGYVVSFEKKILDHLQIQSKTELMKCNKLNGFTKGVRKILMAGEGEKEAWYLQQKAQWEPSCYFAHCHISDDYVLLKLHQYLDIPKLEDEENDLSTVFIKERKINIQNIYEQAYELLHLHIQSLDYSEQKSFISNDSSIDYEPEYKSFKEQFVTFVKEELFSSYSDVNNYARSFELPNNCKLTVSMKQLITIAIIPALQNLVSLITSSLIDDDIFGHYKIANLFITGSFMKINRKSEVYDFIVKSEMTKSFKELIREKSDGTQLYTSIKTSRKGEQSQSNQACVTNVTAFQFFTFLKGELRFTFNTSYSLLKIYTAFPWITKLKFPIVVTQGKELVERTINMDTLFNPTYSPSHGQAGFFLFRYDRSSIGKIARSYNAHFIPEHIVRNEIATLRIEALHYLYCIRLVFERHYYDYEKKKMDSETEEFIFGERQTLQYFK